MSYELGLHQQMTDKIALDLALFLNDYDKLLSVRQLVTPDLANGRMLLLQKITNELEGNTFGLEFNANYKPLENLSFNFAYSYLKMSLDVPEGDNIIDYAKETEAKTPEHQFSLLMTANVTKNLKLNTWLRYVSTIKRLSVTPEDVIKHHAMLDLNLVWSVTDSLELSLIAQNLLDKQHQEYFPDRTNPLYGEVERSVYGQIRWEF